MKLLSLGIDYATIKFQNPLFSTKRAEEILINDIFGSHVEDFKFFEKGETRCYFSKRIGIDIKVSLADVVIEFHGTFFTVYGYEVFKSVKRFIFEKFQSFPRVTELHIAQDFIGIKPSDFEKAMRSEKHLVQFRAKLGSPFYNVKTKNLETIYLNGSKGRWKLTVYDKTAELQANINKSSPEKIEAYSKKGYLDNQITRCELKLKSEYCKIFIEEIEKQEDEIALCNNILKFFYKKHKVYKPTKDKPFDPSRPKSCPVLPLWRKLFDKAGREIHRSEILKDATYKNLHRTSIDKVVEKVATHVLKYNQDIDEFFHELDTKRKEVILQTRETVARRRKTDEYLHSLAS